MKTMNAILLFLLVTQLPSVRSQVSLPNGQLCEGFTPIDVDASATISAIHVSPACVLPPSGVFNAPSDISWTIVPVEDTEPLAVFTSPPNLVAAQVGAAGEILTFDLGTSLSPTDEAGVIIQVPKSQLFSVTIDSIDGIVRVLGGFPSLTLIDNSSVGTTLQATFTTSSIVKYDYSGVDCNAKIESSTNNDIDASGVGGNIQVKGNVDELDLSGVDILLLIQGQVAAADASGVGNVLQVNDPTGAGCASFTDNGVDNSCTTSNEEVVLDELPCTTVNSANLVCQSGVFGGCTCLTSPGVPTAPVSMPPVVTPTPAPMATPTATAMPDTGTPTAMPVSATTEPTAEPVASSTAEPTVMPTTPIIPAATSLAAPTLHQSNAAFVVLALFCIVGAA